MSNGVKVYYFEENSPFRKKNAQKVGVFLDSHFPSGNYKPKKVVDLSRSRRSPTHQFFDWNDSSAAEKYRLVQARNLINCISFVIKDEPNSTRMPLAEGIRVKDLPMQYYSQDQIRNDQDIIDALIESILHQLAFLKAKHEKYEKVRKIFGGVFREIEKAEKRIEKEN